MMRPVTGQCAQCGATWAGGHTCPLPTTRTAVAPRRFCTCSAGDLRVGHHLRTCPMYDGQYPPRPLPDGLEILELQRVITTTARELELTAEIFRSRETKEADEIAAQLEGWSHQLRAAGCGCTGARTLDDPCPECGVPLPLSEWSVGE